MVVRWGLLVFLLLPLTIGHAADPWYGDKERGWFWKEEPQPEKVEPPVKPQPPAEASPKVKTATELMAEHKAMLEEAKNRAILSPTAANVADYLRLQEQTMAQAMLFTDMWQRVRWSDPTLDYAFTHPTATAGVRADRDMTRAQEKNAVKAVAQSNGILFFFKANCPFCEEQGRILRALMAEHGITVLAISLDGARNSHFPNAKPDNGIAAKLDVKDAPAMFVVNPETQETLPLGYGVVALDEIESRIRRLVMLQPGEF